MTARATLLDAWSDGLRPPPSLTVSQWAEAHRVLEGTTSSEPGPYRTDRVPFAREIMDRLSPQDPCEMVVLMKGSQVSGTEMGNNWLGYVMHHVPGPMLVVLNTLEIAEAWSKERLSSLIEKTPALKERIAPSKSRDGGNATRMKKFPGGSIHIAGGNSAASLRSRPVRYLMLDEVDSYEIDADGEGDPVELARKRQATFANRKTFAVSSPKYEATSRILQLFQQGDQRYFHLPCPVCEKAQPLEWRNVRWPPGKPREAGYVCDGCGVLWTDADKLRALARGQWVPSAEFDGRIRSYHLSGLYSPWQTFGDIAERWAAAKGDPVKLQVVVNTDLGEAWQEHEGEAIDETGLLARREGYEGVPAEVAVLTCGVDVQDNRLELEIVGWGADLETWNIDYRVIHGDPSGTRIWEALDQHLFRVMDHPRLGTIEIAATCIDTGGHHQDAVLRYCGELHRQRRFIWPIKGDGGDKPIWKSKRARKKKRDQVVSAFLIGVDTIKKQLVERLRRTTPGPGYLHFPLARDESYFAQLTAERMEVKYRLGQRKLAFTKPAGKRNEALDCRVYATAALTGWEDYAGYSLAAAVDALRAMPENPASDHVSSQPQPTKRKRPDDWWGGGLRDRWRR